MSLGHLINMPFTIDLLVTEEVRGLRLDRFLMIHFPDESRSLIQQWIALGALTRDGEVVTQASYKVKMGEHFQLTRPKAQETHILPQSIPLSIVYEDNDLIVINKPVGMVVHPAPGHYESTLVNALLAHCGDCLSGIGGVKRPGIVHRLDKDTSGLMVVAKNDYAHRALSAQFHPDAITHEKSLKRGYKAIIFGNLPQKKLTLEGQIGRHPLHRQKMALLKHGGGKKAITHIALDQSWQIEGVSMPISLIDCQLATGRTHQIRVHCQSIQCPLLGDPVYGKSQYQQRKGLPTCIQEFNRQALHAYSLSFLHPTQHEIYTFNCELPDDMNNVIKTLNQLI